MNLAIVISLEFSAVRVSIADGAIACNCIVLASENGGVKGEGATVNL